MKSKLAITCAVLISFWVGGITALSALRDADTCWLLALGKIIATSGIPQSDPFSYTYFVMQETGIAPPFIMHQWLSELLFYLLFRSGGTIALVFLVAALTTATFTVLPAMALRWAKVSPALCVLIGSLAQLAASFHFFARPELFSYPLFAAALILVSAMLRRHKGRWLILAVYSVLSAIWCNLHSSFVLAVALSFLPLLAHCAAQVFRKEAPGDANSSLQGSDDSANAQPGRQSSNTSANTQPSRQSSNALTDTKPSHETAQTPQDTFSTGGQAELNRSLHTSQTPESTFPTGGQAELNRSLPTTQTIHATYFLLPLTSTLCTLLNPAGYRLWEYLPRLFFMKIAISETRTLALSDLGTVELYPFFGLLTLYIFCLFKSCRALSITKTSDNGRSVNAQCVTAQHGKVQNAEPNNAAPDSRVPSSLEPDSTTLNTSEPTGTAPDSSALDNLEPNSPASDNAKPNNAPLSSSATDSRVPNGAQMGHVLLGLFACALAFSRIRLIVYALIVIAIELPYLLSLLKGASKADDSTSRPTKDRPAYATGLAALLAPLACLAGTLYVSTALSPPRLPQPMPGFKPPFNAISYLQAHQPPEGPVLNDARYGNMLIWNLEPPVPVFIDTRFDMYGDDFFAQYAQLNNCEEGWQKALSDLAIEWVFLPRDRPLVQALSKDPAWKTYYSDDCAVILQRLHNQGEKSHE